MRSTDNLFSPNKFLYLLKIIISKPTQVDESKLPADKKHLVQRNLEHLQSLSIQVLSKIVKSVENFPPLVFNFKMPISLFISNSTFQGFPRNV